MKPRHLLLLAGLLLTGGLLMFGDRNAGADLAQPVARGAPGQGSSMPPPAPTPAVAAKPEAGLITAAAPNPSDAPQASLVTLLDRAAILDATRAGRRSEQMFAAQSWAPPAPVKAITAAPTTPPVPQAPPLPFSYVGKQSRGGPVEVFLAQGDKTHVVQEGSLIDGAYRVDAIGPTGVRLTYLPLNQTQQLAIRGSD